MAWGVLKGQLCSSGSLGGDRDEGWGACDDAV